MDTTDSGHIKIYKMKININQIINYERKSKMLQPKSIINKNKVKEAILANEKLPPILLRQWLKSFQKENTASTYTMPIEEESFIHFAPNEVIEKINQEKQLKTKSNYAVSTTFGFWFPQVQYSHISRMLPDAIYSSTMKELKKSKKPIPPKKRIPDYGNEISAIRFKTNTIPSSATLQGIS